MIQSPPNRRFKLFGPDEMLATQQKTTRTGIGLVQLFIAKCFKHPFSPNLLSELRYLHNFLLYNIGYKLKHRLEIARKGFKPNHTANLAKPCHSRKTLANNLPNRSHSPLST